MHSGATPGSVAGSRFCARAVRKWKISADFRWFLRMCQVSPCLSVNSLNYPLSATPRVSPVFLQIHGFSGFWQGGARWKFGIFHPHRETWHFHTVHTRISRILRIFHGISHIFHVSTQFPRVSADSPPFLACAAARARGVSGFDRLPEVHQPPGRGSPRWQFQFVYARTLPPPGPHATVSQVPHWGPHPLTSFYNPALRLSVLVQFIQFTRVT